MHTYATLSALESQIEATTATTGTDLTANRVRLMEYARRVTSRIDEITGDTFMPLRQTRYFDAIGQHIDPWYRALYLGFSVADVVSITNGAGTTLTFDTDWRYHPRGRRSTMYLEGLTDSTWTTYTDNWRQSIAIDGVWCYRTRYDVLGWVSSGDTVQTDALTTSSTTVKVTDADGTNAFGQSPRFDVGQVIRIGSEYMAVTAVNTTTNELTVIRAYNGTTATTHSVSTSISTFYVQPEITRACMLITAFNYKNRGNYERVQFNGINTTQTIEIPEEATEILNMYTIRNVYAVYGGEG